MQGMIWRKRSTPSLQVGTTILEINLAIPQKTGNSSTRRPIYTTPEHIPKRYSTKVQGHLLHDVHRSLIDNIQKVKTILAFPQWNNGHRTRTYGTFYNGILLNH